VAGKQRFSRSPLTDSNRRPPPYHQPKATVLACFSGFRGPTICQRLPLVAPARLHKRSMPQARIPDEKRDGAPSGSSVGASTAFPTARGRGLRLAGVLVRILRMRYR
jgi:hypothetical protein